MWIASAKINDLLKLYWFHVFTWKLAVRIVYMKNMKQLHYGSLKYSFVNYLEFMAHLSCWGQWLYMVQPHQSIMSLDYLVTGLPPLTIPSSCYLKQLMWTSYCCWNVAFFMNVLVHIKWLKLLTFSMYVGSTFHHDKTFIRACLTISACQDGPDPVTSVWHKPANSTRACLRQVESCSDAVVKCGLY